MPFQYILADLLASNEQAVGALFLDEAGEAVDVACADYTPYELRVAGAYLGIYLRQLERLLETANLSSPTVLQISNQRLHILAVPMPDGYCLALIQRSPARIGSARRSLVEAARQIRQELFAH
jgi:predicted regulator of Ras-like GTPase activity (Roadblock/LC7/MglB family)